MIKKTAVSSDSTVFCEYVFLMRGPVQACVMFLFVHLTCALVQEVGEQAAHDGLVTDDQHVALSLQLHDNGLQPLNKVLVGLEGEGKAHKIK